MTRKPVDQIIILLSMALLFSLFAISAYKDDTPRSPRTYHDKTEIIPPPVKYKYPEYNQTVAYISNWLLPNIIGNLQITYEYTRHQSLGYYYITAYCPAECGYTGSNYPTGWMTASGTICHRADYENRLTEPTTCAISRSIHSFGDLFYLPDFDRVFIAEDTGSAVKGKHLDLFYEEYSDVRSFPTGWYEAFTVEYITDTTTTNQIKEAMKWGKGTCFETSGGQKHG